MTNEMEKKLEVLLQNPNEINAVFVGDPDQILANFAERGIEMTKEELGELSAGIREGMELPEGELSESNLENVAGGLFVDRGLFLGMLDGVNNTDKHIDYVEKSHTSLVKGLRAIGYSAGHRAGRFLRTGRMD